jgi:hypothetical protein
VQRGRGLGQRVELPFSVGAYLHQRGISQDGQVARDLRLEHVENFTEVANANLLLCSEEAQNSQTSRIRKGAEKVGCFHIHSIEYDRTLWTGQGEVDP